MHMSRRISLALVGVMLSVLLGCATALAAPISVNLRVEGSAQTLFEGPVSTEAIEASPGIATASSAGAHPCDVKDNGSNGGFGVAAATPITALYDAARAIGLAFDGSWSSTFNDFLISQVGSDLNGGAPEFASWGYAVNYTTAGVGGCQFQLASGSEVLWAYNYFNLPHLLVISGPAGVNVGTPFSVHVADAQTGGPISGAALGEVIGGVTTAIPSSSATDANGNATLTLTRPGGVTLKASRSDSVRSNGLAVCVHNGNDGSCGTTVPAGGGPQPPSQGHPFEGDVARIIGLKHGAVYRRKAAPRVLSGTVEIRSGGTLRQVRISLKRRYRGRCFDFSDSKGRFVRVHRCSTMRFFPVGAAQSFSYLLPAALPRGRYVFEMQAVEASGRKTKPAAGISHVVFRVS